MEDTPVRKNDDLHDENQIKTNTIENQATDLTLDEKTIVENLNGISLHQRMLSRMVKVGYEGLNDAERAYWNSVY